METKTITEKELRVILGKLFVPRSNDLEGVCFRSEYMREDSEAYAIYQAVSDAQHKSGLTFDFSYEIANIAVDILAEADDWNDDDDINERIDSAIPVYTGELMQIYQSNSWAVDEAMDDLGGNEHDAASSDRRAAAGWYMQIQQMVQSIKSNIEELIN